jgi:hypothetical protein
MASSDGTATETTPLLPEPQSTQTSVESADGLAPDGAIADGCTDGADVERQTDGEDTQKQYEGMPEVKKNMKYIFPALAIGVFPIQTCLRAAAH